MAKYPGATQRPIDPGYLSGRTISAYNRVNLHITAGNGSPFSTFNRPKAASSHFCVMRSGAVEQFVDTAYRAEADLEGNDATISVETEGTTVWSEAQVVAIIALLDWITKTHGIKRTIAQSSQPGTASHGISWHRLGIDGNFPALPSRYAGRTQRGGGMHYSLSRGKTCPLEPNIDIIHDRIVPALSGTVTPPTPPAKPPVTDASLVVDGLWGGATTKRLQQFFGTPMDSVISHQWKSAANENIYAAEFDTTKIGSVLGRHLQRHLGVTDDGLIGKATVTALQQRMGTPVDGVISPVSECVKEMQRRLNNSDF